MSRDNQVDLQKDARHFNKNKSDDKLSTERAEDDLSYESPADGLVGESADFFGVLHDVVGGEVPQPPDGRRRGVNRGRRRMSG